MQGNVQPPGWLSRVPQQGRDLTHRSLARAVGAVSATRAALPGASKQVSLVRTTTRAEKLYPVGIMASRALSDGPRKRAKGAGSYWSNNGLSILETPVGGNLNAGITFKQAAGGEKPPGRRGSWTSNILRTVPSGTELAQRR